MIDQRSWQMCGRMVALYCSESFFDQRRLYKQDRFLFHKEIAMNTDQIVLQAAQTEAAAGCCSPTEQETCCDPADKGACCGSGSCGC